MSEATNSLSIRGEAIRNYKARANSEGVEAWSAVPCAPDIKMHISKFDVEAVGVDEINTKVFGLMASQGIQQELKEISEFGKYVTCFLEIISGTDRWNSVEVFLFDEQDRVTEIWAL